MRDEMILRRLLWLRHGCNPNAMYGDDGEMQCNAPGCMIDFKRMTPKEIQDSFTKRGESLIEDAGGIDAILAGIRG